MTNIKVPDYPDEDRVMWEEVEWEERINIDSEWNKLHSVACKNIEFKYHLKYIFILKC